MEIFPPTLISRLLLAALLATLPLWAQTSIRTVKVLGSKDAVELEVEASDRIVPQTQVLTGPDRLVIDFPNAVPSNQLRSQSVDRGEVKDVRVGLFQGKPPVTRLVLDLKTAQSYQIFPNGRTVIIKIMGGGQETSARVANYRPATVTAPGLVVTNYTTHTEPVSIENSAKPILDVSFRDGLLGIRANKVTLSQVLFAVQQRTGAEVSIAAGAEQEQVVADIAPAPAQEVLARLLNGSHFNFLILSANDDPRQLDRVILTPRAEGATMPLPQMPVQDTVGRDEALQQQQAPEIAPGQVPPQPPDMRPQPDNNPPDSN